MKDELNKMALWFMSWYDIQFVCQVVAPILSGYFN